MEANTVAVLFARSDSVYKTMPGCDVWDIERDARRWPGGAPVVAHPPCRAWGSLRHMAKPRSDEKDLARWAVAQVRTWGGVLEHPEDSTLWRDQRLAAPGEIDAHGGRCITMDQYRFGHRAEKMTRFYVVGVTYPELMAIVPARRSGRPTHVITQSIRKGDPGWRPRVTDAEREHTPPRLAAWLVDLARRCRRPVQAA